MVTADFTMYNKELSEKHNSTLKKKIYPQTGTMSI
jgi:hypothetical protein